MLHREDTGSSGVGVLVAPLRLGILGRFTAATGGGRYIDETGLTPVSSPAGSRCHTRTGVTREPVPHENRCHTRAGATRGPVSHERLSLNLFLPHGGYRGSSESADSTAFEASRRLKPAARKRFWDRFESRCHTRTGATRGPVSHENPFPRGGRWYPAGFPFSTGAGYPFSTGCYGGGRSLMMVRSSCYGWRRGLENGGWVWRYRLGVWAVRVCDVPGA